MLALLATPTAPAQEASLTLVVPFAAKGPTDTVTRALAAAITERTGYAVDVENRPGAGGTTGTAWVARAAADGRTLLVHHVGMATAPALYRTLPYDPRRDFEPIGRIVDVPMTLVTRPDFPAQGLAAAIRSIRRDPNAIVVAYAGLGAASHLCGLLLSNALEIDLIQVPYRGTGPALADLKAGQADLMCDQTTNTTEAILSGAIQGLAVTSPRRLASLGMLPTVAEGGLRSLELSVWHGLFAPAGLSADRADLLSRLLQAGLESPTFLRRMQALNVVVATRSQATPTGLRTHLAAETARWAPILRKAGQYAD